MRGAYAKFALAWLLCAAVLIARFWPILQKFYLFAEDGMIFFADAWNLSLPAALTTSYAGYYHLLPRLIAEAAVLLPYAYTPWTYAAAALAINTTAIAWLQLPHYRWLIRNDWLRLGIVLLLALAPNWEALTAISYLQWGLAWWAALITLMPLENRLLRTGVTAVYLIAIWTAPILVLLLPIWLLRLWRTRSRGDALMVVAFAVTHFAYLAATLQTPRDVVAPVDWVASLADFARAYSYRVTAASFLGTALTETIHVQYGWLFLQGLAVVTTVLLLAALVFWHPPQRTWAVAVLLYISISSLSFYLLRSTNLRLPFLLDETPLAYSHRRYFILAGCSLYVLLGMVLDGLPARFGRVAARRVSVVVLVLLALLPASNLLEPALSGETWTPYGRLLDAWRRPGSGASVVAMTTQTGTDGVPAASWQGAPQRVFLPVVISNSDPATVGLPIAPQGWLSVLSVSGLHLPVRNVGTNLLFVDALARPVEGRLEADLVWQYTGEAVGAGPGAWWAYLWLVQAEGEAAACQPLAVLLPDPWVRPGQLFFTHAAMPLPAGADPAAYQLAVSASPCPSTLPVVVPPP